MYDVYADDSPDLPADPALRVASGITDLDWRDETAQPGGARWYLVRARGVTSDLEDANETRLTATASGPETVWLTDDGAASTHPWVVPAASSADTGGHTWRRVDYPLANITRHRGETGRWIAPWHSGPISSCPPRPPRP